MPFLFLCSSSHAQWANPSERYLNEFKKYRENIVPLLHAFAKDFLNVHYMFWVNQNPYFEEDVLPCFASGHEPQRSPNQ